jgi:hypothetical protein
MALDPDFAALLAPSMAGQQIAPAVSPQVTAPFAGARAAPAAPSPNGRLDPEFQAELNAAQRFTPARSPQGASLDPDFAALAGGLDPDTPAAAAKAAYTAAQSTPQYLKFGPWTTPVPLPHWLDNTLGGMGGRALQLGQYVDKTFGGTPDPLNAAVAQQLQTGPAGKVGSFLTDTLLTAPIGGAVTSGVARLGGLGARVAGNVFGDAAIQGATQGALTAPPGQRLQGAALGAALSPVLPLAGTLGGKVAQGLTRTPEAQALLDRGVPLTPGQMNPEGAVTNRLEQAFTNLPLIGGKIANARAGSAQQYTRGMLQDALAPGASLTTAPHADFNDLVADAQRGFDQAYDTTLRSSAGGIPVAPRILNPTQPNVYVPLTKAFQQLADQPRLGLTATQRLAMGDQLQEKLAETIALAKRGGGMTADDLQALRSDLRDAARDVSPIDNASRAQKGFWSDAQQSVTQALNSQLPAQTSQALRNIDQQYAKFAIVRRAAVLAKDQPGGPTPAQFTQAIKEATPPNAYAAGGGWNRDVSKAARSVFQSTIPHTGATGAGIIAPVMHGLEGAGAFALGMHNPLALGGALAGLGGIAGAYTRPGLRALAGQTGWQQAAQRGLGAIPAPALEAISRYGRAALLAPPLQGAQQSPAPWMAPAYQ